MPIDNRAQRILDHNGNSGHGLSTITNTHIPLAALQQLLVFCSFLRTGIGGIAALMEKKTGSLDMKGRRASTSPVLSQNLANLVCNICFNKKECLS